MLKALQVIMGTALMIVGSSAAQAQYVSMSGGYSEFNGRTVVIPANPPTVICGAGGNLNSPPAFPGDSRCKGSRQKGKIVGDPFSYVKPSFGVGVVGGQRDIQGSLVAGAPFTVPPLAFSQMLPPTGAPNLNDSVIYLTTTFQAVSPAAARIVNPSPLTRMMGPQGAVPIVGQTGRPAPNGLGVIVIPMIPFGADFGRINYKEGPNKFGGTMTGLLDGTGKLIIQSAGFNAFFQQPVLGTQPVGDPIVQLNERNGMGWNYPITGMQFAGNVRGPAGALIVPCGTTLPAQPANCNKPSAADLAAPILNAGGFLPAANSTKWLFPWTTGTVVNTLTGMRQGQTVITTLTMMGYDTTAMTAGVRNVGLVAGSYTHRTAGTGLQLGSQVVGMELKFTPEPSAAIALFAGVGLLGMATQARRRS